MSDDSIRRGDTVEVRSPAEILATLDARGAFESLPFMPEMAAYCGKRFVVDSRAEKLCDTVTYTGSRRLPDSFLLADLRCSGLGHGGCQAECRLFWKQAWLRKVDPGTPAGPPVAESEIAELAHKVSKFVKKEVPTDGRTEELWACQATLLVDATVRLGTFDPRVYVREYTCGNVSFSRFASVSARAMVEEPLRKMGVTFDALLAGPGTAKKGDEPALNLQPGELVQVKSKEEIVATLDAKGNNRGLWFDREMTGFCGGTFRVRRRLTRIIDDRKSKMVEFKSDCITLEDVVCTAERSTRRWFCPRRIYPYWREVWLKRVPEGS